MKTLSYNTYEYEFKQSLSLINKVLEECKTDSISEDTKKELELLIKENLEKVLLAKRIPQKYDRSTLNGNLITHLDVFPIGRIIVNSELEQKEFYLDCDSIEDSSADSILCDLQDEVGIRVSKY